MNNKTALFFFTQGLGDYIAHGYPVLKRLKEKYSSVTIISSQSTQELIELLSGYDHSKFLSTQGITNSDLITNILGKIITPECVIYNYATSPIICMLLGELKEKTEIRGIYSKDKKYYATCEDFEKELLPYQEAKYFYPTPSKESHRRNRYLKAFGLEVYKTGELKIPGIERKPRDLIVLEGQSGTWSTKNYPYTQELKKLLTDAGYQVFVPSEEKLPFSKLFEKISQAQAILSVDSFVGNIGIYSGIPTLSLLSATAPEEVGYENYIQVKQSCSPCYNAKCQQAGRQQSCLEDLKPEFIFKRFKNFLNRGQCEISKDSDHPLVDYKNKCIHIFCFHGLGDAIRFALPLARSLHIAGAQVFLHVRHILSSVIGLQPDGVNIVAIQDDYDKQFSNPGIAIGTILDSLPPADLGIGLGASIMDQVAGITTQKRNIPYWGIRCKNTSPHKKSYNLWAHTLEVNKSRELLFSLLGVPAISSTQVLLNPIANREISLSSNTIGLHTKAMWPARTYDQGVELKQILEKKFNIWNFDDPPCDSIGNLAHYILQSKAVLSVDTMVIHLCRALNVPALMIQGPVWHHFDNAPNVLESSITEPHPMANSKIDKQSTKLSKISPNVIAEAFVSFVDCLDKKA